MGVLGEPGIWANKSLVTNIREEERDLKMKCVHVQEVIYTDIPEAFAIKRSSIE